MSLTPDLFQQIVDLCKPYMQKVDERRARLFSAFLDSSLEDQISLNDSADVFVPNMLRVVMSRARYNGAHPLSVLLKSLRDLHGDDGRARIDALLPILDALPDGAPLPELPLRLLVSHDDADSAFAQRLRADLKCRHFTLLPHESQDALQAADHVLLIYGSDAAQRDRDAAQRLCKPTVALLRSAMPDDLPDALDFREDAAYDAAFERLLTRLTPPEPLGDLIDLPSPPSYGFLKRPELKTLRDRVCALHSDQLNVQILYGIGGIGKSTLINQLCRDCDVRRRFPDGIIWLTIGAKGALESSLVALQSALETQAKRIQRAERDRRYLVVLDDIWETEFIERFCAKLQHYPRSSLLISTRKPEIADLAGFPKIALDKLDIPLSVQLLQMRLPEADPALCREIAVILDGHALALSIAAAWIARRGSGSAANLLNRLRERRIFEELSLQRENRNYHLEYSLRLSYEALRDEDDQTPAYDLQYCFRQLGALAADGSFDAAAAAALWRLEGYALEDALADLVAEGLLTREGQQRYRMHSLLHAYARLLLEHANELRAADRQHFEYFSAQRSQHNRQQVTADFANIRKALLWTLEDDPRFAAEWTMQLYKHTVNLKREARRALLQDGLRAAQRADKPEAQAFMHRALGDLARAEGDRQRAEEHHQQALECFARATQRRPRDVIAWQMWALLAKERGQIEQARELFARAVEADERSAASWQAWAIMERDLGRYDEARRLFARAVEADERSAASWQAWAIMERNLGRHNEAKRLLEQGLQHVRDRRGKGLLHSTLGGLLASGGNLAAAEAHFRKALEYNDEDAMTHYYFAINVLLRANRREEACRHLCRAKALRIKKEYQRRMIESAIQRNGCQCRQ